jgi:hypothetical protein
MRSYTLALTLAASLLSGCSFGTDRDYQVVVSWLLNGFVPDAALCQELGIATARLEVRSGNGTRVKTLEAPCDGNIVNSQEETFGGFITTRAFAWDVAYSYTLTLLDASGNVRSTPPAQGSFYVDFDQAEYYELGYLDYVAPAGLAAGLHAEWSVRSGDVPTACVTERIAKVRIVAVSRLNEAFEAPVLVAEAPCADGKISSNGAKVLARGDYLFRYEAISEAGSVVDPGQAIPVFVDGSADVTLPRELFLN